MFQCRPVLTSWREAKERSFLVRRLNITWRTGSSREPGMAMAVGIKMQLWKCLAFGDGDGDEDRSISFLSGSLLSLFPPFWLSRLIFPSCEGSLKSKYKVKYKVFLSWTSCRTTFLKVYHKGLSSPSLESRLGAGLGWPWRVTTTCRTENHASWLWA